MQPPVDTATSASGFTDRKTGLVIFGILTTLLGGLCTLFIPLMFVGQAVAARTGVPQNNQAVLPAILMYGALAVILVWLGVGSMLARRWARALLLIFSWSWLIIGLVSIGVMTFLLPQILETIKTSSSPSQQELPAVARALMILIPALVLSVIYVIMPGIWVFFYRSRHVKATCEAYDPAVRWTDRCPLPVIAISLWLAFSAPMMLVMAVAYKGILPVFGTFVVGPLGSALCILLTALWGYAAWAVYRLEWRGWWIVVVSIVLFSISAFVTYSQRDLNELYSLMGYPEEQIAQIQKFNFLKGPAMAWTSIGGVVPLLGYLLYVRKFFRTKNQNDRVSA